MRAPQATNWKQRLKRIWRGWDMMFDSLLTEYGLISKDLSKDSLANVCIEKIGVQTGPFGSQLHNEDYVDVGTPIITVEHLGDNRILHQNTPFVSDQDKERLSKYSLQEGDIVFSRVGSVDRRALVRKEEDGWLFSGRCLRVRVDKDKMDPVYLSYFFGMEGFKNYIRSIAVGATMPSINTKILSDVPIYYPDLDTQRNIAEVLYSIDEKIELNRQTNQTLEQIAQAIFKSWFVDFDPVRAKIAAREAFIQQHPEVTHDAIKAAASTEGDTPAHAAAKACELAAMCAISGKSEEQLSELDVKTLQQLKATAGLFPDALVESELGEVPGGWGTGGMKDCCLRVESGGTPKRSEDSYWNGNINWLSSGEVRDVIILGTKEKISEGGLKNSSAKLWPPGSTVVAMYGATAGQVCLFANEMSANQACCALIPKRHHQSYIFLVARRSIKDFAGKASGSAQQNLNKSLVADHKVLLPEDKVLEVFEQSTLHLLEMWIKNTEQNLMLARFRDLLLPKLLSGEIAIGDSRSIDEVVA